MPAKPDKVRATFAGFKSLPAPPGKHWRDILKLADLSRIDTAAVESAYRNLSKTAHPDAGGSHDAMAELSNARDTALKEIAA